MIYKKYLLLFCLVLLGNTLIFSQNKKDVEEIYKNLNAQELAWNKGSLEGFMAYYWKHDSLKFISNKGITYGWKKNLENYKKTYPDKESMGELKFDINTVEQLTSNSVFVIGKWRLKKSSGDVGGYFTLLWKKINGKWLIVADHTN